MYLYEIIWILQKCIWKSWLYFADGQGYPYNSRVHFWIHRAWLKSAALSVIVGSLCVCIYICFFLLKDQKSVLFVWLHDELLCYCLSKVARGKALACLACTVF